VPGEDGVRADDGGDAREDSTAEQLSLGSQPSSLVIGQAKASVPQLLSEDAVFFLQVVNDRLLVPIDPAGCGDDQ
jgi:hypothetical protein